MRPGKKGAVSFTRARQRRVGLSNRVKLRARCTLIWAVQCIGESNYVAAYGTVLWTLMVPNAMIYYRGAYTSYLKMSSFGYRELYRDWAFNTVCFAATT